MVEKQCAVAKSAITYHAKVSRPHRSCRSAAVLPWPLGCRSRLPGHWVDAIRAVAYRAGWCPESRSLCSSCGAGGIYQWVTHRQGALRDTCAPGLGEAGLLPGLGCPPGCTPSYPSSDEGALLPRVLLCISKQLLAARGRQDRLWFARVPTWPCQWQSLAAYPAVWLTQGVPAPPWCHLTCAGELAVGGWG